MGGRETVERLAGIDPGVKAIVSSGYRTDGVMSNPEDYGLKGTLAMTQVLAGVLGAGE